MGNRRTPLLGVRYYNNCVSMTRIILLLEDDTNGIQKSQFVEDWTEHFSPISIIGAIDRLERMDMLRIEGNKLYYTHEGSQKRHEILNHISNNENLIPSFGILKDWIHDATRTN